MRGRIYRGIKETKQQHKKQKRIGKNKVIKHFILIKIEKTE